MNVLRRLAASVVALAIVPLTPTIAWAGPYSTGSAEQIRKLDIMLMVSSLRCRFGPDDFRADYRRFTANNLDTLNSAGRTLKADLARRHGSGGATRALDRISVSMANRYGQGHPWLGCRDLREAARDLADTRDPDELLDAADYLLADRPSGGSYLAARR